MTGATAAVATWTWAAVALLAGWLGGHLVAGFVSAAVAPPFRPSRRLALLTATCGACGALALWVWQVRLAGQGPAIPLSLPADGLGERWAATTVLMLLLAAAAWIDLVERVIPDAITVPGVLAGLLWHALLPGSLLPVTREIPRSFAPPLRQPDVLGLCGPLHGPWPDWLGPAPVSTGLLAAAVALAAWCLVGTEPLHGGPASPGRRLLAADRTWAAVCGLATVAAAWCAGGDHWRGLGSALGGAVIAAGIVWLTREIASRAIGREAMGLGDATLMATMGAWLGWQPSVLICMVGVFIGLVHGVVQLATRRESELPFGPSLCLACVVVVVNWRSAWQWAGPAFEHPGELAAVVVVVVVLTGISLWAWRRLRPVAGA